VKDLTKNTGKAADIVDQIIVDAIRIRSCTIRFKEVGNMMLVLESDFESHGMRCTGFGFGVAEAVRQRLRFMANFRSCNLNMCEQRFVDFKAKDIAEKISIIEIPAIDGHSSELIIGLIHPRSD